MFGLCRCGDAVQVVPASAPAKPGLLDAGDAAPPVVADSSLSPRKDLLLPSLPEGEKGHGNGDTKVKPRRASDLNFAPKSVLSSMRASDGDFSTSVRSVTFSDTGQTDSNSSLQQLITKKVITSNRGNSRLVRRDTTQLIVLAIQALLNIQDKFTRVDYCETTEALLNASLGSEEKSSLEQLLAVPSQPCEKRTTRLAVLADSLSQEACVGIFILHLSDMIPANRLGTLVYLRCGFQMLLKEMQGVVIIKAEDERIFTMGHRPSAMLSMALAFQNLCSVFSSNHPELETSCSVGLDWGPVVLLPGDYFGDPVNVASKLGEDNAEPGDLNVSKDFMDRLVPRDSKGLLNGIDQKSLNAVVSKVSLDYTQMKLNATADLHTLVPNSTPPEDSMICQHLSRTVGDTDEGQDSLLALQSLGMCSETLQAQTSGRALTERTCAMLQSDMSGFTRLTRKYGIMHFLSLVWQCRRIYADAIDDYGGVIMKYDGDNVITVFENACNAARLASEVLRRAAEFNE